MKAVLAEVVVMVLLIATQVEKPSLESCTEPEQVVVVPVVMVVLSIASLKVTVRVELTATEAAELAGLVLLTVGAVASLVVKPTDWV